MVIFVGSDVDGLPLKRKQSQRACDDCRKRKKRCSHLEAGSTAEGRPTGETNQWQETVSQATLPQAPSRSTASSSNISQDLLGGSFVQLHQVPSNSSTVAIPSIPPAPYFSASSPLDQSSHPPAPPAGDERLSQGDTDNGEDDSRFVGHLNPQAVFLAATSPTTTTSGDDESVGFWIPRKAYRHIKDGFARPAHRRSLTSLGSHDPFVSKVLLPYLEDQCVRLLPKAADIEALHRIYVDEVHPIIPIIDLDTLPSLPDGSPSKNILQQAICIASSTNTRAEKHLALPSQGEARLSPRQFAELTSSALLTSIDLGLCKDRLVVTQALATLSLFSQLSNNNHSSAEYTARTVSYVQTLGLHLDTFGTRSDHSFVTRLFCAIWALDILNAAFHGRPVLMHERDFGRDIELCFRQQPSLFQLFLWTVALLGKVIALYRPSTGALQDDWENSFPAFEDILNDSEAHRAPAHLLATVETLYHGVSMLSCRFDALKEPQRSSPAYLRQSFSASRVVSMVGSEFQGQLSALPVVPYAVSLALRVSYRDLRVSKAPLFRARARRQLLSICGLLRDYGGVFPSATVMCDLAEQTVRQMDKTVMSLISAADPAASRRQSLRPDPIDAHPEASSNLGAANDDNLDTPFADSTKTLELQPSQLFEPLDLDFNFEDVPEVDIFEHFDPDFDLGAIDAALVENIKASYFSPFDAMT